MCPLHTNTDPSILDADQEAWSGRHGRMGTRFEDLEGDEHAETFLQGGMAERWIRGRRNGQEPGWDLGRERGRTC
jgi:hypothetical protein